MRVEVEDARVFLTRTTERYDFILLDVYANESYIPPHLVTREFFVLAKDRLATGGVLACNVNAPRRDSLLLTSFFKTLEAVFPVVESLQPAGSWNRELLASDGPIDWAGASRRVPPQLQNVFNDVLEARVAADSDGGMLLTDDRAPVELLIDAQTFAASSSPR
jgi:spermidine synthase